MARGMNRVEALQWLLDNDDTEWVNDRDGSPSVTLVLLADVFAYSVERMTADLRRMKRAQCNHNWQLDHPAVLVDTCKNCGELRA